MSLRNPPPHRRLCDVGGEPTTVRPGRDVPVDWTSIRRRASPRKPAVIDTRPLRDQDLRGREAFAERLLQCGIVDDVIKVVESDTSGYTQYGRAYLSLQSAVPDQQFIDGYVAAAAAFGVEYTPIAAARR